MKKRNYALVTWLGSILVFAAFLVVAGCEASSPSELAVTVTPDHATLRSGESVTLTASGWNAYKWSLSNSDIGDLSSTVGERVTYRATAAGTTTHTAVPVDFTTRTTVSGTTNKYTRTDYTAIDDTQYAVDVYVYTATTENGTVITGSNVTPESHTIVTRTATTSEEFKQIITVSAVGSSGSTNSSSIAPDTATIFQEE
jgi:hypothetical protein